MAELYSGHDLRQQEKKHDVDANQFAKIPAWGVDDESIGGKRQGPAHKGGDAAHSGSAIERGLEARVAVSFEEGGDREKEERTAAVRDELIEQVSHRLGRPDILTGVAVSVGAFRF